MTTSRGGMAPELEANRYSFRHVIEEVFGNLPPVETSRLLLKPMTPDDLEAVFAYTSDAEVVRFLPIRRSETLSDARAFLEDFLMLYRTSQVAPWGLYLKETGAHIGICGFENWGPRSDRAEMGFSIARPYWGQGYALEAAQATVEFGFRVMRLNRIEAKTQPENVGARRLLEKLGMTAEGVLRENMYWKGAYHDLVMYSLLRREYEAHSAL